MGQKVVYLVLVFASVAYVKADDKVICFYDSNAHFREGEQKSIQFKQ